MSRGYWSYIVAIFGVAFTAALIALLLYPEQPYLAGNAGYQGQAADYRAGGYDCQPKTIDALPRRKRAERAVGCKEAEEEHRLKTDDLIQQRRAAHAAEASSILTYQQTVIGALGLAFGFVTMIAAIGAAFYARHAASETKRGADAAELAVKEAQRIGEAQVRCYLSISEARIKLNGRVPLFQIKVQNSGQSPARLIEASYGFSNRFYGNSVFADMVMDEHDITVDIPAQSEIWLPAWHPDEPLTVEDAEVWKTDAPSLVAFQAEISGKDVFGISVGSGESFASIDSHIGDGQFHILPKFSTIQAEARAGVMQYRLEGILPDDDENEENHPKPSK